MHQDHSAGEKVEFADGTEEDHKVIKTKDPAELQSDRLILSL